MKVQCVICDSIKTIDNESPIAKKLRNRPIHTFMCESCHDRIEEKTIARIDSGNFRFLKPNNKEKEW
ncbi:MAG: YlaI family protein [Bacillus sp. (in: firmicutes)]